MSLSARRPETSAAEIAVDVSGLTVGLRARAGVVPLVRGVDFDVPAGRIVGLVGESGSGKSLMMLAVSGLLPAHRFAVGASSLRLLGHDVLTAKDRELQSLRGRRVGFVFQDPQNSLNPTMPVGRQIAEPLMVHFGTSEAEARARATEMLTTVGVPNAKTRYTQYPHEYSGGMLQRAMIAMALICEPDVLIADEPTTALDVTIQAQILDLIQEMSRSMGVATVLITHNLHIAKDYCEEISVMYAGQIVERAPSHRLGNSHGSPYARDLLACVPSIDDSGPAELVTIPGRPPLPTEVGLGCAYADRCREVREVCRERMPELTPREDPVRARCFGTERAGWIA